MVSECYLIFRGGQKRRGNSESQQLKLSTNLMLWKTIGDRINHELWTISRRRPNMQRLNILDCKQWMPDSSATLMMSNLVNWRTLGSLNIDRRLEFTYAMASNPLMFAIVRRRRGERIDDRFPRSVATRNGGVSQAADWCPAKGLTHNCDLRMGESPIETRMRIFEYPHRAVQLGLSFAGSPRRTWSFYPLQRTPNLTHRLTFWNQSYNSPARSLQRRPNNSS